MKLNQFYLILIIALFSTVLLKANRPNIIWITSEDNSPLLGCYGDELATTPHLDNLARQGVLYENAFANAPVCAPARFTILTGMYASAMGTEGMRSRYRIPEFVKPLPTYLREAGYYCTNNFRTDYNYAVDDRSLWDECSVKATYKNRAPGQPFFHVINFLESHESRLHMPLKKLTYKPEDMILPPYHPDTKELRNDWAKYYDRVKQMDARVGEVLAELKTEGLSRNTIVFYYSDHGGVVTRSKRYLFDTGTHVPLIVRFPKKYEHLAPGKAGSRTDQVVSFVDLLPTVLSLAGLEVPEYLQGHAFLGEQKSGKQEYAYLFRGRMDERFDLVRAVRGKRFKYIRNYMPHRIYGQHIGYLWKAKGTKSWEKEYLAGRCNDLQSRFWGSKAPEELYDTTVDPWEVNNLALDPRYQKQLLEMRKANQQHIPEFKDPGFIPEGMRGYYESKEIPYHLVREQNFSMEKVLETAEMATFGKVEDLPEIRKRLKSKNPVIRYWAAIGCVILGEKAMPAKKELLMQLDDDTPDVRIAAAEALAKLGEAEVAVATLISLSFHHNPMVVLQAASALDDLNDERLVHLEALNDLHNRHMYNYHLLKKVYIDVRTERSKVEERKVLAR